MCDEFLFIFLNRCVQQLDFLQEKAINLRELADSSLERATFAIDYCINESLTMIVPYLCISVDSDLECCQ